MWDVEVRALAGACRRGNVRTPVRFKGDGLSTTREPTAQREQPSVATGYGAVASQGTRLDEAQESRLDRLLRYWWLDEHPAWTERGWWDSPLREEVRGLLWLPAGPVLATALNSIESPTQCPHPHEGENLPGLPTPGHGLGWPCACMVVLSAAWEACAAWAAAGSAVALVQAAGPAPAVLEVGAPGQQVTDPAREELALALRSSPNSMASRISAARDLVGHPRLVALVTSAAISAWAGRLVVLELTDLTAEQASKVVDQVCTRVTERLASGRRAWTSAEVGRAARLARRRLCPDSDRSARERAFSRRRVQVFPDKNGMAVLIADLDETDAHRIHRRLSAVARGVMRDDDRRTCDQVRADVLVDLLLGGSSFVTGVGPGHTSGAATGAGSTDTRSGSGTDPGPGADAEYGQSHETPHRVPGGTAGLNPGPTNRPDIQVIVSLETLLGLGPRSGGGAGLGPHPRRDRTSAGGRRELASLGHGRQRSRGRDRLSPLCTQRRRGPRGARTRAALSHARLPSTVAAMRPRPHGPLPRRNDQHSEPRAVVQAPPCSQDPRGVGLAPRATPRWPGPHCTDSASLAVADSGRLHRSGSSVHPAAVAPAPMRLCSWRSRRWVQPTRADAAPGQQPLDVLVESLRRFTPRVAPVGGVLDLACARDPLIGQDTSSRRRSIQCRASSWLLSRTIGRSGRRPCNAPIRAALLG